MSIAWLWRPTVREWQLLRGWYRVWKHRCPKCDVAYGRMVLDEPCSVCSGLSYVRRPETISAEPKAMADTLDIWWARWKKEVRG